MPVSKPFFSAVCDLGRRCAAVPDLVDEGGEPRIAFRGLPGQRMVGGDRHEGSAEDGVGTSSIDLQLALIFRRGIGRQRPADQQALGAPDPVGLHQLDLLRPVGERLQAVEQILRHRGDLEEPLRQVALLDQRAGTPAAPVDDLLVGEHGHVLGVPVDLGRLAFGKPGLPEIEEHFLLVLVVARVAGGELARPIPRQAHRLELALHCGDVGVGPIARVDLVVARGVLRRQAEGVPADRVQHVVTERAAVARDHVAQRVVADMTHVDAARRIGEHLEHVIFRARIVVLSFEELCLIPGPLPLRFRSPRVISFGCHDRYFT